MAATATKNKVHFGLEGLTFWIIGDGGTYGEAIKVPGIVGLSASPQTSSDAFYADNVEFFRASADNGDEVEIETAGLPDSLLADILGWRIDKNGALIRVANGVKKSFAMAFKVCGDKAERGKVYYEGTASIPEDSNQTKGDSTDVQTEKIKINFIARDFAGEKVVSARVDADSAPTAWTTFFTTPYTPDTAAA